MRLKRLKGRLDSAVRRERGLYLSQQETKELNEWLDSMLWIGAGGIRNSSGDGEATGK